MNQPIRRRRRRRRLGDSDMTIDLPLNLTTEPSDPPAEAQPISDETPPTQPEIIDIFSADLSKF